MIAPPVTTSSRLTTRRVLSRIAPPVAIAAAALACSSSSGGDRTGFGVGGFGAVTGTGGGGAAVGQGGAMPATGGAPATGGNGGINTAGNGGGMQPPPIDPGGECEGVTQQAENTVRPVDIIWAIDTSDSMVAELQAVEAHMNSFASQILNQGIDVHVVVIARPGRPTDGSIFNPDPGICIGPPLGTGACPGASNPPLYQHVEAGVGSNSALDQFINQYPNYKPTLRPNSLKYFAVVSDDDASMNAAAFTTAVNGLDPQYFQDWKFFGVFCTGGCPLLLACAKTGNQYNALVQQTGGLGGDLCGGNQAGFQPVFDGLAQTVVSSKSLDCEWNIPPPPAGEMFDQGKVNVQYTAGGSATPIDVLHAGDFAGCDPASGGWYYDNPMAPSKVVACPATCQQIQADFNAKIDIRFGCFTIDIPR